MKVAIYGRPYNKALISAMDQLIEALNHHHVDIYIFEALLKSLPHLTFDHSKTFGNSDDLRDNIDFVISLGGDGTMLDTVTLVEDTGIPVLAINSGRLGFLANTQKEFIDKAILSLIKGHYTLDTRSLLRLESDKPLFGKHNYALNELTLHRKDTASMMIIHAYLNGEFLNSYWADGLIVSTPTGSTGYSLSCGGPIIIPQAESFVITPIAPHNLNVRPVIIPDKSVITLEIEGRSTYYMASLDSRSTSIDSSFQLAVRKEDFGIHLVKLSDHNFLDTLRHKLMWGLDTRN